MDTHTKRAFSALATVAVLTVTVFGVVGLTAVPVSGAEWSEATTLQGPTTGRVGDTLIYTTRVLRCTGENLFERPYSCVYGSAGYTVPLTLRYSNEVIRTELVPTDANGYASASFTFTRTGEYEVVLTFAGTQTIGVHIEATPTPTITTPTPTEGATPTPTDGGVQPTGGDSSQAPVVGDATSTKTTTSVAGIVDISAQAEAATGLGSNALLIFGIAGVILLAVIAGVLLMRRRGEDEYNYEYEGEEPYRRE